MWICLLLQFYQFLLMRFAALLLGAYTVRAVLSSWSTDPFIVIPCLSLSLITRLGLKSTLSDIDKATSTLSWLVFAWCISFSLTFPPTFVILKEGFL